MKIFLAIACLALAVVAGAAGALVVATQAPAQPQVIESSSVTPPVAEPRPIAPAVLEDADLLARVDALSHEVAALQAELERMKEGTGRAPIAVGASLASASPTPSPDDFADAHRQGILQVIEQDRQTREQQREEERAAREMEALLARAERVAKELGLSGSEQKKLADVYTLESQKIADLRALAREGDLTQVPGQMREQIGALRDWRTAELTSRFGADLAQKINEYDADRWRQGRRGRVGAALTGAGAGDAGAPR